MLNIKIECRSGAPSKRALVAPRSVKAVALLPIACAYAVSAAVAGPAWSADVTAPGSQALVRLQTPRLTSAATLVGKPVENRAGERLGQVVDSVTVFDPRGGRVSYALVSRAGVALDDDKLYPVPTPALHTAGDREALLLHLSGKELRRTGGFRPGHWPRMTDRVWAEQIHRQFGLTPAWASPQAGSG